MNTKGNMNIFSKIGALSLAALILSGTVACSPQSGPGDTNTTPTVSEAPIERAEKEYAAVIDHKLTVKDSKKLSEDNFLATGENEKFTIAEYGILDKLDVKGTGAVSAAENEVFHAVNYTAEGISAAKVSYDVDGTTKTFDEPLLPTGTIIISAPKEAELILNLQVNDLTQSIDLTTGERTTKGIADAWYGNIAGKITDGIVSKDEPIKDKIVNLSYSVASAKKTAYTPLGKWADGGKSAWVVIDGTDAKWNIPESAYGKGGTDKFTLTDENGKEYTPASADNNSYSEQLHLEFKVPADADSFTLNSENYTEIMYFGKSQGSVTSKSSQVKISFK